MVRPSSDISAFLKYAGTIAVAIIISMVSFWLSYGKDLITRTEAKQIIAEGNQSIERDITDVINRIDRVDSRSSKLEDQLRNVLENNTEAIVDLKVQVSALAKTIENLSLKINQIKEN
tara:strand:- start:3358 stop:3711 length:354 start_codon:yes stop_codon:yes gene_type:complete